MAVRTEELRGAGLATHQAWPSLELQSHHRVQGACRGLVATLEPASAWSHLIPLGRVGLVEAAGDLLMGPTAPQKPNSRRPPPIRYGG